MDSDVAPELKALYLFKGLMKKRGISERSLEERSGLSRFAIRSALAGSTGTTLKTLSRLSRAFGLKLDVVTSPKSGHMEYSSLLTSQKILTDGFESWKIHIANWVDEFRRTLDPYLVLHAPVAQSDFRIKALMASIVRELCDETYLDYPDWSQKTYFLEKPWFLSEVESLKAFSILESPLNFRRNNIYVQSNFLQRA